MKYSQAIQGYSGLWFKYKTDSDGTKHILVSETKDGLENMNFIHGKNTVSHDHYWFKNGEYYAQLRTSNKAAKVIDHKGHLYQPNSIFPYQKNVKSYLDGLFDFSRFDALENKNKASSNQVKNNISATNNARNIQSNSIRNKKSGTMASQNLDVQRKQLQELGNFLQKFSQILQENKKNYITQMQKLSQSGLAQEVDRNYGPNYAQPKLKAIDQIVNDIGTRDIPYVKKNLQAIEQAIIAAKS